MSDPDFWGVAVTVIAPAVSVATLLIKINENNGQTRAHTLAARAFTLSKALREELEQDDQAANSESSDLRKRLISSGNDAAERYLELAHRPARKIHWVDGLMYSVILVLLGLSMLSIHHVAPDVGPAWEIALSLLGGFFVALGTYLFFAVIVIVLQRKRDGRRASRRTDQAREGEVLPEDILIEETESSRSGAS